MYKLSMFQKFDFASWQKDKSFMIQGVKYNAKKGCVSLDVVITEDYTDYGDTTISNIFEKFKVHLVKETDEEDVEKYLGISTLAMIPLNEADSKKKKKKYKKQATSGK